MFEVLFQRLVQRGPKREVLTPGAFVGPPACNMKLKAYLKFMPHVRNSCVPPYVTTWNLEPLEPDVRGEFERRAVPAQVRSAMPVVLRGIMQTRALEALSALADLVPMASAKVCITYIRKEKHLADM